MLRVAGDEAVVERVDGRSLLDEIAREGAWRMLLPLVQADVRFANGVRVGRQPKDRRKNAA
jgi:hypothetical protein